MWVNDSRKGNYAIREREIRVRKMKNALKRAKNEGKEVSLDKFKAQIGIAFGLSDRKISEYLNQLISAGEVRAYDNENDISCLEYIEEVEE